MVDRNYKNNPTDKEWMDANDLFAFLKSFYVATKHFSGSSYPTANIFFGDMCKIMVHLKFYFNHENINIHHMIEPMALKFQKYWEKCSLLLAVAVVLDPRYKLALVQFYYEKIYGIAEAQKYIQRVHQALLEIYHEYAVNGSSYMYLSSLKNDQAINSNVISGNNQEDLDNFHAWYEVHSTDSSLRPREKSELELYLEEDLIKNILHFDILEWWKVYSLKFQVLGKIARDILAVPVTTVSSESAFSIGGRVIDEERSCLDPMVVDALLCVNNWIKSNPKDHI